MEASASAAASARGASLHIPPSQSRKQWRAVADHHHSTRNPDDDKLENAKPEQSDERTIYEVQQGREPLDVNFCSLTLDGTLDNDILQQQLHNVVRQRHEVLQVEIELKAQVIARTEIMEMRSTFDAQLKEHANNASKLQEQFHEKEHTIHELERKLEDKDRELHTIKLDNEAAWAKQDLLREQSKELATFRRDRNHSEAERAQHINQIHDLQEHFQEKESQLIELQEQQRVAQEAILYKDEQLREAQAWIARVREMDVFQSTTNQTLQAELRERTEQCHQLWMGFQRQYTEMERLHLHTIQQLQLELAEARERSGTYSDDSQMNSKNDVTQFGQDSGNQFDLNGGSASGGNNGHLSNQSSDNVPPFASSSNATIQEQNSVANDGPEVLVAEQVSSSVNASGVTSHNVNHNEMVQSNSTEPVLPEAFASTGQTTSSTMARTSETSLLDERSLLACIVRTIPAGGWVRISSTLPNRLGKMLAPLHWHDYKRKYGKLDDFVASHPELFMIEGDSIQLREGAQKMVAAAVAKVAAAAAASSPYSSYMPTVAVTPMAQSHRLKKAPSIDSKNIKADKSLQEYAVISTNIGEDPLKLAVMQHQQSNGVFSVAGGLSNVKILSKSKDTQEMNDPQSRTVHSSVQLHVGNGGSIDRSSMSSAQNPVSANGRVVQSFALKPQSRATGAAYPSRR
ncbi:PREDICTED: serine/threonine-protein kinase dst2-like isoform X7 [Lupinus angustifolius]|uniref:serine/threonine-protein kinase dst2-like isoform X7 n=1 Tax=Lupinus angustifolius TaxID=3871 RepID=UPI00092F02A1|nr:PREDICTED: serine/threonine-protein kinase dst2-like isoform X7 [Lupinus angustifolius]